MSQRFEHLWTQFLEGEIDENAIVSLEEMMASDDRLVAHAADLYEEHRLLGYVLQPFEAQRFCDDTVLLIESENRRFVGSVIGEISRAERLHTTTQPAESWYELFKTPPELLAAIIAVVVVLTGVWLAFHEKGRPQAFVDTTDDESNRSIAILLLEEDSVWSLENGLQEGERLTDGPIELQSGTAVLRFDSGAEVVMVAPARLDLKSADRVLVRFGDVVVRAADGAEGFIVLTPTTEVVDLGTEFAVKVNRQGITEVHVLEGEVSCRQLNAPEELIKILRAGEGISIDEVGQPVSVPMNSPRFKEYVRRINPRSRTDLLTAYDGFNYSPGVLGLEDSDVGFGWAGPWRRRLPTEQTVPSEENSPDFFNIVHGQMNVTWPVPGGRMGMLKLPSQSVYYLRQLRKPIDLNANGVTYFSLMVRESTRPEQQGKPRERMRLTFRSLRNYYGEFISFGHASRYRPQIKTSDTLHTSPMILPSEQTALWIGKIVARKKGEDEIYFRVYGEGDALGYAEPATWHAVTRGVVLSEELDCVLLSSEGTTERIIDELRIGPTWRSVAPILEVTE